MRPRDGQAFVQAADGTFRVVSRGGPLAPEPEPVVVDPPAAAEPEPEPEGPMAYHTSYTTFGATVRRVPAVRPRSLDEG